MTSKPDIQQPADVAANYGLARFNGDAEVAEDLGIAIDPETRNRQFAAGREVAALLDRAANTEPVTGYTQIDDESVQWNAANWRNRSPAQLALSRAHIHGIQDKLATRKQG